MKIIKQSHEILTPLDGPAILKSIELAGRTCYKSEDLITEDSAKKFVEKVIKSGHHSVIEHVSISCRFITDRGVTHELVRHRLCAFSQESTRYCNYGKDKFGNEITVILPVEFYKNDEFYNGEFPQLEETLKTQKLYMDWRSAMNHAEFGYLGMLQLGATPQLARSVLPNSLKTEIVTTCNLREWRHILKLRTSPAAHPQIRALMKPVLAEFQMWIPIVFDDIAKDVLDPFECQPMTSTGGGITKKFFKWSVEHVERVDGEGSGESEGGLGQDDCCRPDPGLGDSSPGPGESDDLIQDKAPGTL